MTVSHSTDICAGATNDSDIACICLVSRSQSVGQFSRVAGLCACLPINRSCRIPCARINKCESMVCAVQSRDSFCECGILYSANCSNSSGSSLHFINSCECSVCSLFLNLNSLAVCFGNRRGFYLIKVRSCYRIGTKTVNLVITGKSYLVSLCAILNIKKSFVCFCRIDCAILCLYLAGFASGISCFNINIDTLAGNVELASIECHRLS